MASLFRRCLIVAIALAVGTPLLTAIGQEATPETGTPPALPAGVTVVASGLNNPRGFAWDDAGTLHLVRGICRAEVPSPCTVDSSFDLKALD